jgi:hypothetical protein
MVARHMRVLMVAPNGTTPNSVIVYTHGSRPWFNGYAATELQELADFADRLEAPGGWPDDGLHPDGADWGPKDVLVCGHAQVDRCCGSMGTALFRQLAPVLGPGARCWQASDLGGHRFAPTFMMLPEGTLWAYADLDLVRRVVSRTGDIERVLDHYRGCSGLGPSPVHALEREILRRIGWRLFDCRRSARLGSGGRARITVQYPGHDSGTWGPAEVWSARIGARRSVELPRCGGTDGAVQKIETEWTVRNLSVGSLALV